MARLVPKIYPNASWRKVQSPLYDIPGILINVKTEVSVATIESIATTQCIFLPAKKYDSLLLLRFLL